MIRPLEQRDNAKISRIVKACLTEYGLNIPGTAYFDPQLDDLYSFYGQGERYAYWVLDVDGQIAGGVGIAPYHGDERIAELQKLYIDKPYRGNGFSTALIEKALAFARLHYPAVYIETSDLLERANLIYPKYGFCQLEEPLAGTEHTAMNRWYLLKF